MDIFAILTARRDVLETVDRESWRQLVEHLIAEVESTFDCQLTPDSPDKWCLGSGFCVDIKEAQFRDRCPIYWKGILGATIIQDALYVTLTKFLYYGSHRLVARDGNEFVDYEYKQNDQGEWRWRLFGWFKDENEEYEDFDRP
ncbi:MAG: hypothetical protein CMJ46_01010 [Planctomyces sp.]|nr:hypothetical protein [Planctomyces sp.]